MFYKVREESAIGTVKTVTLQFTQQECTILAMQIHNALQNQEKNSYQGLRTLGEFLMYHGVGEDGEIFIDPFGEKLP